mmetsp:Transcript_15490/g.36992  ORF Transcript_15490/g.36992 Transcript_15490/m.36992 type:complete len:238 (-) Transcript_15490:19-732(-)
MLDDALALDPEQVVERGRLAPARPFRDCEREAPAGEHAVDLLIDDRTRLRVNGACCCALDGVAQGPDAVGRRVGVVLGVRVSADELIQSLSVAADADGLDELASQGPAALCQARVPRLGRPVDHGVAGGVWALSRLDVVPVLDSEFPLESEHLEPDPPRRKVVLRVTEDVVPVLEGPDNVDAGIGLGYLREQGLEALPPRGGLRVVLDVFVGVDDVNRSGISGLDAGLEELSDAVGS